MKEKIKSICTTAIFMVFIVGFGITFLIIPDKDISQSERRTLLSQPNMSIKNIQNGEWFEQYDKYMLDQFPLREEFRTIKAISEYSLFAKKDNNDIYISDGYVCKLDFPLDEEAIIEGCDKINHIYETMFYGIDTYYSIIPDKNYFLASKSGHLCMDYEKLFSIIKNNICEKAEYIDIVSKLNIDQYYQTDLHWEQQSIIPIADTLLSTMNISISESVYNKKTYYPFYGAYFGQAALPITPDKLTYLTNDTIENCIVYNPIKDTYGTIYETSSLGGIDSYDVFLSGAEPILIIDNPMNSNGNELYIVRDSFSSSLAPLLIEGCSRIVLIDPRYISSDILQNYIQPSKDAKVLFILSTPILNKGYLFK